MKIAFIGLGKLGLACANNVFIHGYDVVGYDVNSIKADFLIAQNVVYYGK